jgi:uncharacterized membrane protein
MIVVAFILSSLKPDRKKSDRLLHSAYRFLISSAMRYMVGNYMHALRWFVIIGILIELVVLVVNVNVSILHTSTHHYSIYCATALDTWGLPPGGLCPNMERAGVVLVTGCGR